MWSVEPVFLGPSARTALTAPLPETRQQMEAPEGIPNRNHSPELEQPARCAGIPYRTLNESCWAAFRLTPRPLPRAGLLPISPRSSHPGWLAAPRMAGLFPQRMDPHADLERLEANRAALRPYLGRPRGRKEAMPSRCQGVWKALPHFMEGPALCVARRASRGPLERIASFLAACLSGFRLPVVIYQ